MNKTNQDDEEKEMKKQDRIKLLKRNNIKGESTDGCGW